MKVEVVVGEIREDRLVEGKLVGAMERQGVRRASPLCGRILAAGAHLGQQTVNLRATPGWCYAIGIGPPAHLGVNGADHPRFLAFGPQHRLAQMRGGGLAVGAGDADHHHLVGGTTPVLSKPPRRASA